MIRVNRLAFCLGGVLLTGCALPKMNSEWDDSAYSGEANAGGTRFTAGAGNGGIGTAGRANGQAGRTNTAAGGTTSSSGASYAGQFATLGGTFATGGIAGASVTDGGVGTTLGGNASGGTSMEGGTSTTGGLSGVAGNKAAGGSSSSGGALGSSGSINVAGALSRGGASGSGGSINVAGALSRGGASSGGVSTGGVSNVAGTSSSGGTSGSSGVAGAAGASGKPVSTAIAAGWFHSCALLSDGTVRCWGNNCNGRLGDGGVAARCAAGSGPDPISSTPIHVQGIAQATAIACGGYHTCAIVDEGVTCPGVKCGTVKCWGSNLWGQLGYSSTSAGSASPVNALGITTATAVVAGQNHTCALLSDSSVKCWGTNGFGQLGAYDSISEIDFPTSVVVDGANTLLTGVTKLSTSGAHTCAIVSGSQVYCWGDNRWSQLGTSTTDSESYVAIPATRLASNLGSLTPAVVGAGNAFSCALVSDGSARCWGSGTSGELGNAAKVDSDDPVKVAFSIAYPWAADLSAGYSHACAILANGNHTAQCWGSNTNGEIGNADSGTDVLAPADVTTGSGSSRTILTQVQSVAAGKDHTCAIANGVPYCWGYNGFGALGTGDTNSSTTARLVTGF